MKKLEALKLLLCQKQLNDNRLPKELIDECYKLVPDVTPETFQRVKIQAIQRFVTFNMDIISAALQEEEQEEHMKTTVVIEQSPVGKKVGKTSTRPKTNKKIVKK